MLLKQLLSIGSWQSQQLWLLLQEALVSRACKMVPPCKFVCVGQKVFLEGENSCLNLAVYDSLMP